MRTILARHLTGDHVEREIEVRNAAKLGQWRPGKLEAVTHYASKTVLAVYWDDAGALDEWTIDKRSTVQHVRVPELPAPIPTDCLSTEAEERARLVTHAARGHGKRSRALAEIADRASVLGPCPECHVAATIPCVALPDEAPGILGRIHGERILEAQAYEADARRRMREGRI